MAQPKAFEHLLATNPGIDAQLVKEAEARLDELRKAGVDYSSAYRVEPALGATHAASPLRWQAGNEE